MAKKVLIVDDSRTVRQQVGIVLTESGYDVLEASDGVEGAERIERGADLSMVICDVNMPRMSGLDMLAKVKGNGKNGSLPILMLTTEGQAKLIARARESGASGWIVKPFKPELLLAAVKKLAGAA